MKKILSMLSAAAIGALMAASAFAVSGDINGDGAVDILDVVNARGYIVGNLTLTDAQITEADTNGDGELSIIDVVNMRRAIVNSGALDTEPINFEKLEKLEGVVKSEKFINLANAINEASGGSSIDISMLPNIKFEDVLNDDTLAAISTEMGLEEPITVNMLVNELKINDLIDCIEKVDFTGFEAWLDTVNIDGIVEYYTEYEKMMAIEDYDEWSAAYDAFVAEYEPKLAAAMNEDGLMSWIESIDTTGFEAWATSVGLY